MKNDMKGIAYQDNEAQAPGQSDNEDLHDEIISNLKYGRTNLADWRTNARENYDFYAGKQWDDEDILVLQEQNRPVVTFNRTGRTINSISGLEIQNRQEIQALPRQVENSGYSDVMTQAFKWIREGCDAEDEESEAFKDALISGLGYIETRTDVDSNGVGKIKIILDRIDPLDMVYDPESRKPNLMDARWVARIKQMTKKEFMSEYPGVDFVPGDFWNSDIEGNDPHDATNAWKYENDQSDKLNRKKTTWVAQYQYWEKEVYYKVLSPDGTIVDLPQQRFNAMKKLLDESQIQYIKYKKSIYKECFVNGNDILSQRNLGVNQFTLQALTGFRDRNNNTWFGIVTTMKDPQRWANKWLSQIQHILNTSAKNGLLAEEGAFKNPRKAEEEYAKPGSITQLNSGGLQKIQEKTPPQYPEGIDRLLNYAMQSINDVTGVNLELIGMADRDQPIGLEESRKQAGVTILAPLFNSLRRYRKIEGRILSFFIREYIPEGELIRITGDSGAQYIPLMKDQLAFEYDIMVDDAPTSPNMKEKIYPILNQSIQMALQAGIPIPPDVLDYAPLPDALIQKWKSMIVNKQQGDPMAEQMKQIQLQLAQVELQQRQVNIQKTGSEISKNYAMSEQEHALALDQSALAQQRMDSQQADQQLQYDNILKEQQRKDLELILNTRRKDLELQLKHHSNMKELQMKQAQQQNQYN